MKKWLIGLAMLAFAGLASAQTIPVWIMWSSSWVRWDGGPKGNGSVGPYSGTPVLGDMIYFNGTNWVSLAAPANGNYSVHFASSIPSWTAASGGTTIANDPIWTTAGQIAYATGNAAATVLGIGGANTVLHGGASAPAYSAVATGDIAASAVTLAKIANAGANSRFVGSGSGGSGAAYTELSSSTLVFGASSVDATLTTTNDGGAIIKQSATPGTQQGSGGNANFNHNGTEIQELDSLAATPTDGHIQQNTTAAAAGTQQYSPAANFCGQGWGTTGSTNEKDCWRLYTQPVQGTTSTSNFLMDESLAGGAYTTRFTLSSAGSLTIGGAMSAAGNYTTTANSGQFNVSTGANGSSGFNQVFSNGGVQLLTGNRLVTGTCSGATTCSTTTNLPANAVVLSIGWRVTQAITGATTWEIGTANLATAFCTGITGVAINTTGVCGGGTTGTGNGQANGSAAAIVATSTVGGNFTAGIIEFEVWYILVTPPTS